MWTNVRIVMRRLARWCFGRVEREPPVLLPFRPVSPERLRLEAAGRPARPMKILCGTIIHCQCQGCRDARKQDRIARGEPI